MNIFVTGGTGFTGKRVLPLLKDKGHIRCLIRPKTDSLIIQKYGYEIVIGDLSDEERLTETMKGCDVLINIASIGFGHGPGIVRSAEKAGIKRAIFISTTALFTTLNTASKKKREEAEEYIKNSSLAWTILRPTMIYGAPDDRNIIRLIRWIDRFPMIPVPGSGNFFQQPVYVEDVAKAIVQVFGEDKTIHKTYNICGKTPNTFNEIIDLTSSALNKKVIKIHLPYKLSLCAVLALELLCGGKIIKKEQIQRLQENKHFHRSDAANDFGYNPLSFQEGITREIALYLERY